MSREPVIESIFDLSTITGKTVSGDGKLLSYVLGQGYKEFKKPQENKIILKNIDSGSEESISESGHQLSLPKFSMDDKHLSYISGTDDSWNLHIRNLMEKAEMELKCPGAPIDYRWGKDNEIIMLTSPITKDKIEKAEDGHFFEETDEKNRIFKLRLTEGFSEIKDTPHIWEFDYKSGKIYAVSSDSPREGSWFENYIAEISMNGLWRKIYRPSNGQVALPSLSNDSSRLSFVESIWSDRGVTTGDLMFLETTSGKVTNISKDAEKSYSGPRWDENGNLLAICQEKEYFMIERFSSGNSEILWKKRGSVGPGMAPDFVYTSGKIFIEFSDQSNPSEIFVVNIGERNDKQITTHNEKMKEIKTYEWKSVSWKSVDGLEINGFLRNPGKNMPSLVIVHGGPTGSVKETFMDRYSYLLPEGYSIFMPNFRGSTGRGRKFAGLNFGDMGGMDLHDVITGVQFLIKEGYSDRNKIAITGGSYGGFMTQWAITQTDIFRSAISLFGISDWISFHGTTNIPEWDEIQYDQKALEFDKFLKFSPLRYVKNIKTPLLIMHGESDPCVPVSQSFQFYRALKENGKDVRLLLFPREGHGFTEKEHILQSMKETRNFLEKTMK